MDQEYQAHVYVEVADKKLNPGCWEALCTSKEERQTQARENYERAANLFKLEKKWFEAGECYERCASLDETLKGDASDALQEASHCFKQCDKKRSIQNLNKAVMSLQAKARFSTAAEMRKRLAQDYEEEGELVLAIEEYKKAIDYFQMEKSNSKINSSLCSLKVADLMILSDHKDTYEETRAIYEKIALEYLTSNSLKFSAKELFMKCVLVYLAYSDYLTADAYLSKFLNEDPTMYDSLEHILLKELVESVKEKNVARLRNAVTRHNQSTKIDRIQTVLLNKIRVKIEQESTDNILKDTEDFL